MHKHIYYSLKTFVFIFITGFLFTLSAEQSYRVPPNARLPRLFSTSPVLYEVLVEGLQIVPVQAVYAKLPLTVGKILDPRLTKQCIKNLLALGCFSDVRLEYTKNNNNVSLYVVVKEKYRVSSLSLQGNDNLSLDTIEKKLSLSKIRWIDLRDIQILSKKIKKLYTEKQYHNASISHELKTRDDGSVEVVLHVNEGHSSRIRCIEFKGNACMSRHQLKRVIASKEYWILGFLDRGGIYKKEIIDYDKYQIENFYQSKGFFQAHVKDVVTKEHADGTIDITYIIEEGPLYRFGCVIQPCVEMLHPAIVNQCINFEEGDLYCKDLLRQALVTMKSLLGEQGYINANIMPKMKVHQDLCTVDIEFVVNAGKPTYVHAINIIGNNKTLEKIFRRELLFNEGDLLTSQKLDDSKRAIESLGYCAQGTGVMWQNHTFDTHQADLDLVLQEARTGKFFVKLALNSGSDAGKRWQTTIVAPTWYDTFLTNSNIGVTLQNSNWLGKGIRYYLDGTYANVDRSLSCGMGTNWLFDWPVSAGWNAFVRSTKYEDFRQSTCIPNEQKQGADVQLGFRSHYFDMALFGMSAGFDHITYAEPVVARLQFPGNPAMQAAYSEIVKRSFQPGTITWITGSISDDKRNHPSRPTCGYQWILNTKIAIPNSFRDNCDTFGYIKAGIDARWYTPLIVSYGVVFHVHAYAGIIHQLSNLNVPYSELFHVGGPQSVRGFLFGQIGPTLLGSSLGGTKAFFVNAEIQCPISHDGNITGVLFYDGGSAWDTIFTSSYVIPGTNAIISPSVLIKNNAINYRHSIGLGIRLVSPAPLKIDWGFKLDRNRKIGESLYEVHITMEQTY